DPVPTAPPGRRRWRVPCVPRLRSSWGQLDVKFSLRQEYLTSWRRPVASDRDPRVGAPAPARGMIACAAGSRLGAMADVPDRLEPSELRASDADRERVAEVLRQAAAEGRLDLNELDERLGLVYAA